MSILLTLVLLSLLVVVHELGHFLAARLFGVRVLEFSVGFGPLLAKAIRRGTQYSLRGIPLGGYCKLSGMDLVLEGEAAPEASKEPGSLRSLPAWKKAIIVLAGPVNNFLIAALIITIMLAAVGAPKGVDKRPIIGNVDPKSPGYEAGLSANDLVTALNGKPITLWTELVNGVRASKGEPVSFTILRQGHTFDRTMQPFYDPEYKVYRLGIYPRYIFARLSLGQSIKSGFTSIYWVSASIVQLIGKGLTGKARVPLSGPVGVVGAVDQSFKAGPWWILQLLASISLFLALFNLLPIPLPILDRGWVAIYLIEWLRGREFTGEQKAAAQFFGLIVMAAFFVFVTYGDVLTGFRRFLNR